MMRRLRKFLKWAGLTAGMVLAISLIANAWFVWSTGSELAARLEGLRRAGDPIQLADLAHLTIPSDQNADTYLRRAQGDLDAIQKELIAAKLYMSYPPASLSQADKDKLEKLFAAHPGLMPLLEQAADAPEYEAQLDLSGLTTQVLEPYMKRVYEHRTIYRVARARAGLLIARGSFDDAIATHLVVLRLTRHWQKDPLIMGYLVAVACKATTMDGINEVLRSGTISPASRKALDDELARQDSLDGLSHALRSERAFSLATVREMPMSGFWIARGFMNVLTLGILDLFDRQLQDVEIPASRVFAGKRTPPKVWRWPNPYGAIVSLLDTSLGPLRDAAERVRAFSRSLRVLNAIQAQVPAGSDTVVKLADLGLPAEATVDPYNGEPLHVKKLQEGWTVYSVGRDLVDGGGKLEKLADVGFGPIRPVKSAKKL